MAKKTRTELSTLAINTNLPDNTQELITPTTERSQLTDERESVINYKDDLGGTGNAGKFLTVATDGESLTMVDEPSGVPDWVTFITAVRNQMLLKAGGDGTGTTQAWLKFTSYDGAITAQINFNGIDGSLYINGSQSQIQLSSTISFILGGTPKLTISSAGETTLTASYSGGTFPFRVGYLDGSSVYTPTFVINDSGNVGIGTASPSSDISGSATLLHLYDGTNNNLASLALQAGNQGSKWEIAALAANALGFFDDGTERLRISSAGNVGIGSGSNTLVYPLEVHSADNGDGIFYKDTGQSINNWFGAFSGVATIGATTNHPLALYAGGGEKMRISSGGNVGIGTDSPSSYYSGADNLVVKQASGEGGISIVTAANTTGGLYFADGVTGNELYRGGITYDHNSDNLYLTSGGNQRLTISSGGEVDMVGTLKSGGNQRFGGGPAHGNSSSPGITTKANSTAGVYWNTNGSGGWGGGTFTTNNSDRNMKKNIIPMDLNALNVIGSLETKYFNWTEKSNRGDTTIRQAGIIAQDLKELMPEGVFGTEWDDNDEDTNGLSLDSNATTALFIKAIQEQQTIIEDLKARIEKLEL